MANNYVMYNGERIDLPDEIPDWVENMYKKKNNSPFWSKDTIQIGDIYCDSSDFLIEGRTYDDYPIENSCLAEARLMKTERDAEIVYIRELLNRKLWQYKYEHDDAEPQNNTHYYLWSNRFGVYVVYATDVPIVGITQFNNRVVCQAASQIIEDILEPYSDDTDFCWRVLGVK